MTGMVNIGASYKYCWKSPYEAKPYFFGSPSSVYSVFRLSSETLLFFREKIIAANFFALNRRSHLLAYQNDFSRPWVVYQYFAFKIFNWVVAEHILWIAEKSFLPGTQFLGVRLMLLYTI